MEKPKIRLICPKHSRELEMLESAGKNVCSNGCDYPIINYIARFVDDEDYAESFGLQWNDFSKTQLDSYTGLSISRDRLTRIAGGSLDCFTGKTVLEVGCGAGRFTEIMLEAGGIVTAVDISAAVEANFNNCSNYDNYFVIQADLRSLPFENEQFDLVVCIGVIQHTPDPEEAMIKLCENVRPGGKLLIDHYTYGYPVTLTRRLLRSYLLKTNKAFSMRFCKLTTKILWPFHRALWYLRWLPLLGKLRKVFLLLSPVVDYHDAYPQLGPELLYQWAILDTHDTLTDYYKHLRSAEEIEAALLKCGMVVMEAKYAGNGVEVRAEKQIEQVSK